MEPDSEYELSEYEKLRLERIKRNQEKLAALGLDKPWFDAAAARKKKNIIIRKKKTPSPKPGTGTERRSNRLSKSPETKFYQLSHDFDEEVMVEQRASASSAKDEELEPYQAEVSVRQVRRRVKLNRDDYSVSEEDMKNLRGVMDVEIFLSKFREFLRYQDKISDSNERSVMRQVRKLALGEGIRYESEKYGWPEGKYFRRGEKITLMHDIVELMDEAMGCEAKWGRDRGNGWLLSHPLKKLLIFQMFCLKNPSFLASKCKIKEYIEDGEEHSSDADGDDGEGEKKTVGVKEEGEGEEETTTRTSITSEDSSVTNKAKASNASINKHIDARVAKNFDDGLFFGTITKYDSKANFWFVLYDDGDSEQFDKRDLNEALRLYKKNAAKDPENKSKQSKSKIGGKRAASRSNNKVEEDVVTPIRKKRRITSPRIGVRRSPRCVSGI